jgi:hypothetical protein
MSIINEVLNFILVPNDKVIARFPVIETPLANPLRRLYNPQVEIFSFIIKRGDASRM